MGLRVAVANGDWSNPSTWEGGILPTATDVAATNGFVVNIDQDITVECLTNTAHPANSVPVMQSLNVPGGFTTASTTYNAGTQYAAWKAFDGNNSTAWLTLDGYTFGSLSYEFKTAKVINRYKVSAWSSNTASGPRNWTFEAWDGTDWVVLETVTNNSLSSYIGTISNTIAYKQYRINATSNNGSSYLGIGEFVLDNVGDRETPSTYGGSFTVIPGIVITCTQTGLYAGLTLITINTSGTYNFVANIAKSSQITALSITGGNPTINIIGDLLGSAGSLLISATQSTINITGNLTVFEGGANCLSIGNGNICNITGNIIGYSLGGGVPQAIIIGSGGVCYITGNVFYTNYATASLISNNGVLSVVGTINATGINNSGANAVYSDWGSGAINLLSGPFIFSTTGVNPTWVSRMHLIPVFNSYVEFRDNSTNALLPPAIQAPATRLVSPDTVADAPSPNNVRQGVSYSSGALIGTMAVPSPSNVANNIPVDNTVGTAVLDASSIWAVPLTNLNTSNSIGKRIKNAATVETTGAQLESLIRDNE